MYVFPENTLINSFKSAQRNEYPDEQCYSTWIPQLNTDLALFLKRQGKARLAANGRSPWQKLQRRHGA